MTNQIWGVSYYPPTDVWNSRAWQSSIFNLCMILSCLNQAPINASWYLTVGWASAKLLLRYSAVRGHLAAQFLDKTAYFRPTLILNQGKKIYFCWSIEAPLIVWMYLIPNSYGFPRNQILMLQICVMLRFRVSCWCHPLLDGVETYFPCFVLGSILPNGQGSIVEWLSKEFETCRQNNFKKGNCVFV